MKHLGCLVVFVFLSLISVWGKGVKEEVSVRSLLKEMVNREHLTRFPYPDYRCWQVSSTDPLSVSPDSANWFANSDRNNFLGIDSVNARKEYILMDERTPGAIVRFWATVARYSQKGILRIYIDDKSVPAVEGELLKVLSGDILLKSGPLNQSLSPETEYLKRGHNLYLPIPYAKSCKITYESDSLKGIGNNSGEILYYNINYREYDKKVKVESFSKESLVENRHLLEQVQMSLSTYDRKLDIGLAPVSFSNRRLSHDKSFSCKIEGKKAIRMLKIKLQADNMAHALDSTMISVSFDGKKTVWAPVGAFFCTGSRISPYKSWYSEVTGDGELSCFWVMPFRNNCEVNIENLGAQEVVLENMEILSSPYSWDKSSMYFAASWFKVRNISTRKFSIPDRKSLPFDVIFLRVSGKGIFAGDGLSLRNTASRWWGEGDEKIYIDDETFPSHFGTGTEDYYGYAWCSGNNFYHPFVAQPNGEGASKLGRVTNLRYRSLDAIPFHKSFRFDMELWHWADTNIDFSSITYWYISPDDAMK